MKPRGDRSRDCDDATARELAVWYPTSTLTTEERRMVEQHAAGCPSCAGLLRFASDLRGVVRAEAAAHPEAEALVRYADAPASIAAGHRARLELHLAACESCAEEVALLEEVEREEGRERIPSGAFEPEALEIRLPTSPVESAGRSWWSFLGGGLFRPAAAVAYLTVAIVAVSALLVEQGARPSASKGGTTVRLEGVLVLPDASGVARGAPGSEDAGAEMVGERDARLLLELTNLEATPAAEATYRVVISPAGADASPAGRANRGWQGEVRGVAFARNYTLLLSLPAGTLAPGSYRIAITAPGGEQIFASALTVR